jgi:hypothetical protein
MRARFSCGILLCAWSLASVVPAQDTGGESQSKGLAVADSPQAMKRLPSGVILVKGAWASASDSVTPVPEAGRVTGKSFTDEYFGMTLPLPAGWTQKFQGPPPSENGRYVLAQLRPADDYHGPSRGNILITAQDLFFTPLPAANSLELSTSETSHLQSSYRLERRLTRTRIAGRPFTAFAYGSPVAEMHWYVLATQIRCHAVEFVLSSRDSKLLERMMRDMNTMTLPAEAAPEGGTGGGGVPICIKDYAHGDHVITRADPIFTEHRFTAVPVRIIIDKSGEVRHIHFLSAFPDQESAIANALHQWRFKPYRQDGQPAEVETGIMFGRAPSLVPARSPRASTQ